MSHFDNKVLSSTKNIFIEDEEYIIQNKDIVKYKGLDCRLNNKTVYEVEFVFASTELKLKGVKGRFNINEFEKLITIGDYPR